MAISKTVLNAIAKMSKEELLELNSIVVKAANTKIRSEQAAIASTFKINDKVKWNGKYGSNSGVVQKVNRKTIIVKTAEGMEWKVSPSLLKRA